MYGDEDATVCSVLELFGWGQGNAGLTAWIDPYVSELVAADYSEFLGLILPQEMVIRTGVVGWEWE